MALPNEATPLKLDPISAQIIRQHMIHSIERISDEDLEEPADEPTDESINAEDTLEASST